ncbi:flagellar hook-length control protein FliK [Psychrosphaera aestuarii]|uniref:flagellar hook-length control protein FliK n=1 Tax=Psychrosphaera aestuarii TaxID=1266052 RepID=UPI001B3429E4|nr:flagellar hook-length control protein FliK [Psychrosphaera aestuarii]
MLQQHRILPEPLPTKPVERDVSVKRNQYESKSNDTRQDFDSAMVAINRRQKQRQVEEHQAYKREQSRVDNARDRNSRDNEVSASAKTDYSNNDKVTANKDRNITNNDKRASSDIEPGETRSSNSKQHLNEGDKDKLTVAMSSLQKDEKANEVLQELATKFSGKELVQKLNQLLNSLIQATGDETSQQSASDPLVGKDSELFDKLLTQSSNSELATFVNQLQKLPDVDHLSKELQMQLKQLLARFSDIMNSVDASSQSNKTEAEATDALFDSAELTASHNDDTSNGHEFNAAQDQLGDFLKKLILGNEALSKLTVQDISTDAEVATENKQPLSWLNNLMSQVKSDSPNNTEATELQNSAAIDASSKGQKAQVLLDADNVSNLKTSQVQEQHQDHEQLQQAAVMTMNIASDSATKGALQAAINTPFKASQVNALLNTATSAQFTNGQAINASFAQLQADPSQLQALAAASELGQLNELNFEQSRLSKLIANSEPSLVSPQVTDVRAKADVVDVLGVQLDKTLQAPKLESVAQAKSELMIKENILFNKQELASNIQQQVGLMMARNMKSIDIRLDPPELGSMQIKLSLGTEQASVSFVVSNQQAKDALENSIPRLRELLEQQGMQLADSNVKKDNSNGQSGTEADAQSTELGQANTADTDGEGDANDHKNNQQNYNIASPWQVDYYA